MPKTESISDEMLGLLDKYVSHKLRGRPAKAADYAARLKGGEKDRRELRKTLLTAGAVIKWQRALQQAEAAAEDTRATIARAMRGIGQPRSCGLAQERSMFPDVPDLAERPPEKQARRQKVLSPKRPRLSPKKKQP